MFVHRTAQFKFPLYYNITVLRFLHFCVLVYVHQHKMNLWLVLTLIYEAPRYPAVRVC